LFGKKIFSITKNLKYVSLALVVIATTLAFAAGNSQLSWGGAVGSLVSNSLIQWLGKFGTGALLGLIYFSFFIWKFNPTFKLPERKTKAIITEQEAKVSEADAFEEFQKSKLFIDDDMVSEDMKLGIVETDENGKPVSGNKLKSDSNLVSVILPDEENIPFEINEKEDAEEINEVLAVETIVPIVNDLYSNQPTPSFEEVITTPKEKFTSLADLPLEINETSDDEVEEFESEIEESALEKLSVGSMRY